MNASMQFYLKIWAQNKDCLRSGSPCLHQKSLSRCSEKAFGFLMNYSA